MDPRTDDAPGILQGCWAKQLFTLQNYWIAQVGEVILYTVLQIVL